MKRLVGYDLNGWSDFAARNWLEIPGQEPVEDRDQVVKGGAGGVVVRLKDSDSETGLIGGMQAARAPHGRGGGWGDIGAQPRHRVSDLLTDPASQTGAIAAALKAMAGARKATVALAIPDLPDLDEHRQEALLKALRQLRPGRAVLVWRPVLAVLAALQRLDRIGWSDVRNIGIIGHDAGGFVTQTLRLRHGAMIAPERRDTGRLHPCGLGLKPLLDQAETALRACCANPDRAGHVIASDLPHRLALGFDCPPEPLRKWNASWELIAPPPDFRPAPCAIPDSVAQSVQGCDLILFETPTRGAIRRQVHEALVAAAGRDIHALAPDAVALGALEAARRLSANRPVYFDFLPQISTIVQDGDTAKNYDLIPKDALLPAGQPYRSTRPAVLGLQPGTSEIKVHLKKETAPAPRRAEVRLPVPQTSAEQVELHVQQTPAAGAARLTLVSPAFSGPVVVDWDSAEELSQSWPELIDSLTPEMPTIPHRLVLPCGTDNWYPRRNRPGLLELLQQEVPALWPDWNLLASKLSNRPEGRYAVSSDGELPDDLPAEGRQLLARATELAETDVRARLDGGGSHDNHSLKFLTWLFARCPDWVVPAMLDALGAGHGRHVFFANHQSRTLLLQGVGRTARAERDQRRAFDHLFGLPEGGWKKDQMACAAFLLSRTDTAPMLLTRDEVEHLAKIAEAKVHEAVGRDFTTRYSYGPYLLVGLLRWRLKEPWALVAGRDETADRLLAATQRLADDLAGKVDGKPHLDRYLTVLEDVCKELEGKGTNPNLLVDLESFTRSSAKDDA
ncbi:hypothetical protein [Jhaorihella thermophila]|uniref:Uncharacterized protein n=1 Tax=Jhaorihella thermophila TaxID=488547 RepID=A0A1H5YHT4_9RHOB|nr:hypothetical protein [Jhaorihella thermophila]SEG23709.1 hypothetical protein SAMN05421751_1192 [Jhaorihella thermophila]